MIILELGVFVLVGVVMVYVGVIVFDYFLYGSFFYVMGGSVNMKIKECLKLILYELFIGFIMVIVFMFIFGVLKLYG